jgi:hypothetical protein
MSISERSEAAIYHEVDTGYETGRLLAGQKGHCLAFSPYNAGCSVLRSVPALIYRVQRSVKGGVNRSTFARRLMQTKQKSLMFKVK